MDQLSIPLRGSLATALNMKWVGVCYGCNIKPDLIRASCSTHSQMDYCRHFIDHLCNLCFPINQFVEVLRNEKLNVIASQFFSTSPFPLASPTTQLIEMRRPTQKEEEKKNDLVFLDFRPHLLPALRASQTSERFLTQLQDLFRRMMNFLKCVPELAPILSSYLFASHLGNWDQVISSDRANALLAFLSAHVLKPLSRVSFSSTDQPTLAANFSNLKSQIDYFLDAQHPQVIQWRADPSTLLDLVQREYSSLLDSLPHSQRIELCPPNLISLIKQAHFEEGGASSSLGGWRDLLSTIPQRDRLWNQSSDFFATHVFSTPTWTHGASVSQFVTLASPLVQKHIHPPLVYPLAPGELVHQLEGVILSFAAASPSPVPPEATKSSRDTRELVTQIKYWPSWSENTRSAVLRGLQEAEVINLDTFVEYDKEGYLTSLPSVNPTIFKIVRSHLLSSALSDTKDGQ